MTQYVYVLMRYESSEEPAVVSDPEPVAVFKDEKTATLYGEMNINYPYGFDVQKVELMEFIPLGRKRA